MQVYGHETEPRTCAREDHHPVYEAGVLRADGPDEEGEAGGFDDRARVDGEEGLGWVDVAEVDGEVDAGFLC
jgi:hypothetical protein